MVTLRGMVIGVEEEPHPAVPRSRNIARRHTECGRCRLGDTCIDENANLREFLRLRMMAPGAGDLPTDRI